MEDAQKSALAGRRRLRPMMNAVRSRRGNISLPAAMQWNCQPAAFGGKKAEFLRLVERLAQFD